MQCTCRDEIEEALLKKFKTEFPNSVNHECRLNGSAMVLGKTLDEFPEVTAELQHTVFSKNGKILVKKIEYSVQGNYCIFCGKPAKPQQTEV